MNKKFFKKGIRLTIVLFLLLAFAVPITYANHLVDENEVVEQPPVSGSRDDLVCRQAVEDLRKERVDSYNSNFNISVGTGAMDVPVYDQTVADAIENLGGISEDLAEEMDEMQELLAQNEIAVRRAHRYLRAICEKEYEEDHTLQHAWARLIGEFVAQTKIFIERGYNGNPAFITSQPAYYQLVNVTVSRVFLEDIVASDIGESTKRAIIEGVSLELYAYDYPYDAPTPEEEISPDDLPENLTRNPVDGGDFYSNGGYDALGRLFLYKHGGDEETAILEAFAALENRRAEQITYEQEKLAWGNGFFSYEICDLAFQNSNPEDRRNCRISTPGSLIQDQTSFVFGSALRQMELNDEYEEWIAPNTLAVLSDVLSYRGFNNLESRNTNLVMGSGERKGKNATEMPSKPTVVSTVVDGRERGQRVELGDVDLNSTIDDDDRNDLFEWEDTLWPPIGEDEDEFGNQIPLRANQDGPLPYEFSKVIDYELFNFEGQGEALGVHGLSSQFFGAFLNPQCYLDLIDDPTLDC